MTSFDIITIVTFSLIVVICGMAFSGSGKSIKSFFAGGGAVPWWISGLSLFMSFFSAGTFVVWGAIAYKYGWVAVAIQWTMAISGFIIGFVFAPKWQKTGVLTGAEFITRRLGYNTQKVYSYLFLLLSVFTTGAFLYPVAKIMQVSTGIPVATTTIILGLIIIAYTSIGGMWAVVVTDVLQFIVLTAAVLIIVPLAFHKIGGVSSFLQKAPKDFFNFFNHEYSVGFLVAFAFYNLFYLSGNWTYIQRYTTVKTPRDARKVGWLFGALYIISPVIWMLPPMIYRILNPGLQGIAPEGAYLMMCKVALPVGMMGMILGAMIFATSSSVNTTLNISAGVFTNDLYKHFFPHSSEKKLIKVARFSTLAFGICTIIVALLVPFMGGIVEVVLSIGAMTGAAMFLPPLWCLFSRYQTGRSVLTVTIITLLLNLFLKFISPYAFHFALSRSMEMIVGVGIPVMLLSLYEIRFRLVPSENPVYEKYLSLKTAEVQETPDNEGETDHNNRHGRRVIALGIVFIGLLILSIGIKTIQSGWIILVTGALILALGIAMNPRKMTKAADPGSLSYTKKIEEKC
ncbi:MAG: sodium:solute symporter family protein [Ginsengibacter sp.]